MIAFSDIDQIKLIQMVLGVTPDGVWGPKSQAAFDKLFESVTPPLNKWKHDTYASSFADPVDIKAFEECKAEGKSDNECFKVGDNGIGCWGDSTVEGTGPSCALPPETMTARWKSKANAKHKEVLVQRKESGKEVVCILKDQMPSIKNLHNKAHIDLNPDACAALGLEPPIMEPVLWWWV
jgi:hypothetical protein